MSSLQVALIFVSYWREEKSEVQRFVKILKKLIYNDDFKKINH